MPLPNALAAPIQQQLACRGLATAGDTDLMNRQSVHASKLDGTQYKFIPTVLHIHTTASTKMRHQASDPHAKRTAKWRNVHLQKFEYAAANCAQTFVERRAFKHEMPLIPPQKSQRNKDRPSNWGGGGGIGPRAQYPSGSA